MQVEGKTLYGNEWIDYNKSYLKCSVDQEGIYNIDYQTLIDHGYPLVFSGSELVLYNNGKEIAIFTTTEDSWTEGDYLLFYGERNDGYLDRFHYNNWETDQLNPKYSMYSDTRAYYLTIEEGQAHERYQEITNDLSGTLPLKQEFYMHSEEQVYSEFSWNPSAPDVPDVHFSSFIKTEGFGLKLSSRHSLPFNTTNIYNNGINPSIRIRTGSNPQPEHIVHISVNDELIEVDEYQGNQVKVYDLEFSIDDLNTANELKIEGKGFSDLVTIAHAALIYPRAFDAKNQTIFDFELDANLSMGYYEIKKFNPGGSNFVFDIKNKRYLKPQLQNGVAKFVIGTEFLEQTKLVLVAANIGLKTPKAFEMLSFQNFDNLDPEYLILTSELLNNADSGVNPIKEYAAFRSSQQGGSYKTGIVNVEELYGQFAYGVDNHSLAVRNFSQYVKSQWPSFKMVFIIGKSLSYNNKNKNTTIVSFVPTYGKPGSDILLFADKNLTYAYVGVGRLAARNAEDVLNYLDKAKRQADLINVSHLSIEDRMWMKDIIHLSGGDPGNQELLFNHLNIMKNIIEGPSFGGNVTTYRKTSSDPVQTALSQQILNNINNGISLLTFFGHASASTFDFSVEDPSEYENTGKLPLILSMGCLSGDIHETVYSLSEDMILTKDLGAIAFVASSGSAFPTPLAVMGKDFYSKLGNEFYGEPVGLALQQLSVDLYDPSSTKVKTLNEQNTMHGDPAIRLFGTKAPDYVVDFASINTNGEVGATDETIHLSFDIVNLGKGIQDSINNMVIHEYGESLSDTIYFTSIAPTNRLSVSLEIPNPGFIALGKNAVEIVLDIDNRITEEPAPIAENNNSLKQAYSNEGYCFFVFDNSAFPVYPRDFAIVNKPGISLIASSTNAFADKEVYLIEIDTTELFNSPQLRQAEITSSPSKIEWSPNIIYEDNTVYYWRVSPKRSENALWNGSSFIYLTNSSDGWNQSHLYQWQKDDYTTYEYDEESRDFLFEENINDIDIKNGVFPLHEIQMTADNNPSGYLSSLSDGEIPSGVYISTFDGVTGLPWINKPSPDGGLYESELYTWWAQTFPNFPYRTDTPENRAKAIRFLDETIPDGNYVIVYTIQRRDFPDIGNYRPEEWAADASVNPEGKDLMSVLEGYGATRVRELESEARPYILAFKKGDNSFPVQEIIAQDANQSIELDLKILGSWFEGSVRSTLVGPAVEWNSLEWNLEDLNTVEDSIKLNLYGVNSEGTMDLLFEDIKQDVLDISTIDANIYPQVRLQLYSVDETSRTSAQMQYWRIHFKEMPEALLDIPRKFTFNSDTLFLGDRLSFCSYATNVSQTDMDSLLVNYTIVDINNKETKISKRIGPLLANTSLELTFDHPTDKLLGVNQFRVEINPEKDQIEEFDFNNIGVLDFVVQGDRINPLLDITFDGIRIMEGDIVSPTPHIRIELKDENDFLLLQDISNFDLAIQKLPDNQSNPIDLNDPNIIFTPADTSGDNIATLEYYPELEEGEYILYVQATDMSGNLSGDQDIEARFKVIEDTRVSSLLNYPNPFSISTQFIFTITGYELPEVFTIQIMTVSGKIVREITKEELGDLRIGLNRTSYRWDGRDEYGSRLANGVYLYRVLTSFNETSYTQLFNENVDKYFTKGFGKLVIMR